MRKLLIAEYSQEQLDALAHSFRKDYTVLTCSDGITAAELLRQERPDTLIIDLDLPMLDGASVLRQSMDVLPSVILATSLTYPPYIDYLVQELHIGFIIRKPCPTCAIARHIAELERLASSGPVGATARLNRALNELGIETHLEGYEQLRIGIPLFAQDPTQPVFKGLYTNVAAICRKESPTQIERTVRVAIQKAWSNRDDAVWAEYFGPESGTVSCPSNKVFIATLAKRLA